MSFLTDAELVIKALNEYYNESINNTRPVINQQPLEKIIQELGLASSIKTGGLSNKSLFEFLNKYLATTTRLHHPTCLAHQVSSPHYIGALGSLIDGFTNNPMAIYEMGPGATSIEYFLINWLLEKVGWNPSPLKTEHFNTEKIFGGGILTHGGSIANLTALIAARNKVAPDAWEKGNPNNLALLAPSQSHYSIARGVGILGIGQNAIYHLPVNKQGAVIPDKISFVYEKMVSDGKCPVALVANACSTAVGIYDPIKEIAEFCKEKKIWLHIDGAHGASALLSKKYKHHLQGIEMANSLTWDAHKLMRVPVLCAALLVRDHRNIGNAFKQEASYLFHDKVQPGFDFIHRTIECTKAGLGLKLFMVLAALGEQGLEKYIDRQVKLTLQAFEYITKTPEFTCAVKPQSNILCFRVKGDDSLQIQIRDKLVAEGSFHLSTTLFQGIRYLRFVIMSPETNLDTIKKLIQRIKDLSKKGN